MAMGPTNTTSCAKQNHISSIQSSCSNSVHPSPPNALPDLAKPTIIECPETPEPGDSIDLADHPGCPASIATHDPEFDKKHAASSLPTDE